MDLKRYGAAHLILLNILCYISVTVSYTLFILFAYDLGNDRIFVYIIAFLIVALHYVTWILIEKYIQWKIQEEMTMSGDEDTITI